MFTGSTMLGLLTTGLPIVLGLRKDLNEEYTQNSTETTELRLQLMHEQLAQQTFLAQQHEQLLLAQQQQIASLTMLVNQTC